MLAPYSEIKEAILDTSRAAVQAYCSNHAAFDSAHFADSYVETFNYRQNLEDHLIDEYLADAEPDTLSPRATKHSMLEEMLDHHWIGKTGVRSDNNVEYHLFRADV